MEQTIPIRTDRIDRELLEAYENTRLENAQLWNTFDYAGHTQEFENNRRRLQTKLGDLLEAMTSKYSGVMLQIAYTARKAIFFDDMQQAAADDNLELLEVLDMSSTDLCISFTRDKFMLFYFTDFFRRVQDLKRNYYAQILFERILDTSDNDRNEYITIMNDIFSIGKNTDWFDRFYHPFQKLLARAPDNAAKLRAATRGLAGTAKGIRELCQDFVMARTPQKYVPASLYDPHDPNSLITLTFPAAIRPFIGMRLIGTQSTYKIKISHPTQPYHREKGFLTYNCVLTGNYFEKDRYVKYLEYIPMTHNQHTVRRLLKQVPGKRRRMSRFPGW